MPQRLTSLVEMLIGAVFGFGWVALGYLALIGLAAVTSIFCSGARSSRALRVLKLLLRSRPPDVGG